MTTFQVVHGYDYGLDTCSIRSLFVYWIYYQHGLSEVALSFCLHSGCTETYEDFFMGSVHFKDVALAHILVYENTSAKGRHLCVEAISHYGDFAAKVAELYPEYNIPR